MNIHKKKKKRSKREGEKKKGGWWREDSVECKVSSPNVAGYVIFPFASFSGPSRKEKERGLRRHNKQ